jgi:type I restriction enzyme S subunit
MNSKLGPYPKYKDSGIPWLGQIPAHWDVRRNGRLFAQRNETGFGELPILEVSLRTGVRVRDMDNLKRKQVMSDAEKYKRAAKGDIAYNMMRMWQGALGTAPVDGLVSPAYVVARPFEETNPYYYSYLFRTEGYKAEVDGYSRGIVKDRNRLYWQDFKRMPSCFPPPEEQAAIVRFLDANAVSVRQYIYNRRRVIEVLTEQRRETISRLVTKGLEANLRLKRSGVEWLGDTPESWEIRKLGKLFRTMGSGTTPAGDEYYGGQIPWVMTGDLNDAIVETTTRNVTAKAVSAHSALRVYPPGSVLVALYGATIGKTGILAYSSCTNQACSVFAEPYNHIMPEYIQLVLMVLKPHLVNLSYGGGQPNINSDIVRSQRIPVPPLLQQQHIVETVRTQTSVLDGAITTAEMEIVTMEEFRARFVCCIVEGKMDVRDAAADLEPIEYMNQGLETDEYDQSDLDDEVNDGDD